MKKSWMVADKGVSVKVSVYTSVHLLFDLPGYLRFSPRMGRKVRVEYAGATYHLMCRGNRRADIFENDGDRQVFLETLAEVCERTGWRVCAYVLMSNHYHMVIQTPEANLVAGMKWFQGTYTKRYNARNRMWGHLFQGRYKAVVIDSDEPEYFRTACDYVHLNPARARLVGGEGQPVFSGYAWSSSWYLSRSRGMDPTWLDLHRIVEAHGLGRKGYLRYLEGRALEERGAGHDDDKYKPLRRGWCFGAEEFKDDLKEGLVAHLNVLNRDSITGEPRRMHDEYEALVLLQRSCEEIGLDLGKKDRLAKNDLRKALVSWLVIKKTAVTQEWVAAELGMGSRANVSRAVRRIEDEKGPGILERKEKLENMYRCVH
jgi:putative transposase